MHKAVKIIDKSGSRFTKNILHIKTHLKQNRSNNYVSNKTVNKALNSKALQNPIFSAYKNVLEYARFIINGSNLEESNKKEKNKTYGFLVNVAELFEIYVTKLLQKEFSDWHISSPKIELYENQFFARKIIPDIVMIKGRDVLIFDTKYKRMLMRNRYMYGGDVDRCDFFQINSYMSYYQNQDYNVIAGGLLYPMEVDFDNNEEKQKEAHSDTWFGNKVTKFIVDGIDLTDLEEADNDENIFDPIKRREEVFIARIKKIIKDRGITVE